MKAETVHAIAWQDDYIRILDQTQLPNTEKYIECRDIESVAKAIERLSVRGAPAIGIAAAMALALGAQNSKAHNPRELMLELETMCIRLQKTRPTAVNLQWAVKKIMDKAYAYGFEDTAELKNIIKQEALSIYKEDVEHNRNIGKYGQEVVPDTATIITICNTGSLATGGHGTALGVIRTAHEMGKKIFVVACETRPLLQGARLTAWELQKDGIPFSLITDSMAGYYMKKRGADLVIAGADRIAANGDTANKIGTYSLSVLAKAHKIPFYIAAPVSTIDMNIKSGVDIIIEERSSHEVTTIDGRSIAPADVQVWNPAFDIVPYKYISGIITERGMLRPPFKKNITML
ncbi:MAG: S-methyl-5-thioribose-1-phosphate isomerase [Pseudomonadota bacterium]